MSDDTGRRERSTWLVSGLAASCAILVFRVVGAIVELLASFAARTMNPILWRFSDRQSLIHLIVGFVLAVSCTRWLYAGLKSRSLRVNYVALIVLAILAMFPLRFQITEELSPAPAWQGGAPLATNVAPAELKCRLIDGKGIEPEVIITEQNIESVEVIGSGQGVCDVEIVLDTEGRRRMGEVTASAIGKRMGFWLDGELICSPEIKDEVSGRVRMPVRLGFEEAMKMARRLDANR